jgi:hypothetical protein
MFGLFRGYAYIMADLDGKVAAPAPLPDYSEDGVDLTLVRWMLSRTPAERLQLLEEWVDDVAALRELNAGR